MHNAPSSKKFSLLLMPLALLAVAGSAHAQKTTPGLWETTMTMKMQGGQAEAALAQMQQQLAKMPPEQRKMMQDMMAKQGLGVGAKPSSVRTCLTPEQAARQEIAQQDSRCKRQSVERSGNKMRFKVACEGPPPTTGEGEFTFNNDKSYEGRMLIDSMMSGKPQRMEMQMSGRWISADCGSVKPVPTAPAR